MKGKKIAACVAALATVTFALPLGACRKKGEENVHVYMPDGAPAIALAAMMHDGYADTDFTVVTASTIGGYVASGKADMAIMPINAAAKLYNDGVGIKMLTVNTHGNMYLVGKTEEQATLESLAGKRVGSIGQGQVPDLTLRMMLDECGVEFAVSETAVTGKAAIRYPADNEALPQLLKTGKIDYAFMPEPAVSTAVSNLGLHVVMDAQQQWTELFGGEYPQACLVATTELVENDPDYVDAFIARLKKTETEEWAENNPEEAVQAVKDNFVSGSQSTLAALSAEIIGRCNIKAVDAATARATCETYFGKLVSMQTGLGTSVISAAPDDGFYYSK
ncbi:MAG: ABC transporter substrate-binding protein [Roseburia sp.]|nr:ABC transporter substrate-binding protein [Roseburia sp.]